ncbi:flagellar protein FliZ [Borreliella finlandensis]|uniref:Flagellar protein FliZ n=1 Tax=Borreliella finlandensis TaxID=498741 RepID=A0A826HE12_9SPIR|nr:flagellar protein FliZ [Borreliella finlandensis]
MLKLNRIINILENVYIFLVSSNSFTLLKEIKSEEELEDLKLRLSKINDSVKKDSFQSIFKKMLLKKEEIPFSGNDYVKLEEKIETSLKDKQDRLKKF